MDHATFALVEGAYERIDHLECVIRDSHADAMGEDLDPKAGQVAQECTAEAIPAELDAAAGAAVEAVIKVLLTAKPRLDPRLREAPPEWWPNALAALRMQADEGRAPLLLRKVERFKPYIGNDVSADLIRLILIARDAQPKLVLTRGHHGFRHTREPYAEQAFIAFDPEVDKDVRRSLNEACREILSQRQPCGALLRRVLDEFGRLLG